MRSNFDETRATDAQKATHAQAVAAVLGIVLPIVACVVAAWWGALEAGFVFDDLVRIVQAEERLASLDAAVGLVAASQRPLVEATLALNYAVGSLGPSGYHALNIGLHAGNAALLGLVVAGALRVLRARGLVGPTPSRDGLIAVAAALLWALHPLQASAATYVVQRAELMAALGTLLALWFLMRGSRVGAIASVLFALLSKPTAVSAPFVLLAFDAFVVSGSVRVALRERRALHAGAFAALVALGVLGVTGGLFGNEGRIAGYGLGVAGVTPLSYAAQSLRALGLYMAMLVQPGLLAIDRGPEALEPAWCAIVGGATLLALALLCWRGWSRWWGVLPVSFVLLLAPTTSIVPIADAAVDHRMYLPSAAVAIGLIAAGVRLATRRDAAERRTVPQFGLQVALQAGLLIALIAEVRATVGRNRTFCDPIALWSEVVAQSPAHARGFINRAGLLLEAGRLDEAEADLDRAAALQPGSPVLMTNRAMLLLHRGDAEQALTLLTVASGQRRVEPAALGARGDALRALGELEQALGFYALAAARAPSDARFAMLEANVLADLGRHDESVAALARARARTDDRALLASIAFNEGNAHFRRDRFADAARAYREALAFAPDHAEAQRWLQEAERHGGR